MKRHKPSSLKVLQVLPALNSGGVERGTLEIAEALINAGHGSFVLSAGGHLVEQLEQAGSTHVQWDIGRKSLRSLLQILPLRRWLAAQQFDIIHLRSRLPAWITWCAYQLLSKKQREASHLISTLHGMHSVSTYSKIMACGERVICVSKSCEDYLLKNYPDIDASKIRRIYRGIAPDAFPYGFQAGADWKTQFFSEHPALINKIIVTLPGRITRLKGHKEFLRLIGALKAGNLPVGGLIVGAADSKSGYLEELKHQITAEGLKKDVVFTGLRQDIREIFSISDVIFSLSEKPESFGRTTLEALSLGRPVIGFDYGGVGEILAALFPFGMIARGDHNALTEKAIQIVNGNAPNVKENTVFLLDEMKKQTLSVYDEVIADHTRSK